MISKSYFHVLVFCATTMAIGIARADAADVPTTSPSDTLATVLDFACAGDSVHMGRLLDLHPDWIDATLDTAESDTCTPLLAAAANMHIECVNWLIGHNVKVDFAPRGDSPLFVAARQGDMDVVQSLLDAGSQVDGNVSSPQLTPLAIALFYDHPAVANELKKRGAKLDVFSAAGLGDVDWLKLNLKKDPKLAKSVNAWGTPPLHFAGVRGQIESAKELLAAGADPNAQVGAARETALHQAGRHNHGDFVRFLLAHGADPSLTDAQGKSAADWAAQFKADEAQGQLQP